MGMYMHVYVCVFVYFVCIAGMYQRIEACEHVSCMPKTHFYDYWYACIYICLYSFCMAHTPYAYTYIHTYIHTHMPTYSATFSTKVCACPVSTRPGVPNCSESRRRYVPFLFGIVAKHSWAKYRVDNTHGNYCGYVQLHLFIIICMHMCMHTWTCVHVNR